MYVFEIQRTDDYNPTTAEYLAQKRPRSSRSILSNGHPMSYNFESSTLTQPYRKGMFLKWSFLDSLRVVLPKSRFLAKTILYFLSYNGLKHSKTMENNRKKKTL